MAATEQQYYESLVRTDHPVFRKDFSTSANGQSPFNVILNRVFAKQLVKLRAAIDELKLNVFPHTVDSTGIDKWEETYFNFTRTGFALSDRITALLRRINHQLTMSLPDVIWLSETIVGQTPIVIRNLQSGGWVLDVSAFDVDTIFPGDGSAEDGQTYLVIFTGSVDSVLLGQLDNELTRIEKGGSRHIITAPPEFWVLDVSAFDVNTIME